MRFSPLLFSSVLLFGGACKKDSDTTPEGSLQPQQLQRTWLHAHEEDQDNIWVYRPDTYNFPSSRGRTGFRLEKNSIAVQFNIAPTDGIVESKGTWELENGRIIRIFLSNSRYLNSNLEIVSLKDDVLKVRQLP